MISRHTDSNIGNSGLISGSHESGLTTYPRLCLALRNLIIEEAIRDIQYDLSTLSGVIAEIERPVEVLQVKRRIPYKFVAGVDAGSQRVPLASQWSAVIAALAFELPNSRRFYTEPEMVKLSYNYSSERFQEVVSIRRETKLFKTAERFLKRENRLELLLIDGPLAFGNWWWRKGEEKDRFKLVSAINDLLDLCAYKGVSIAGVVKRATARYLINSLGLTEKTTLPDAYVLLQMLRVGERTECFSPKEAFVKAFGTAFFMEKINHPIYSFYLRASSSRISPPIRIDIPEFMIDWVDDIAGYCYATSVKEGVPLAIIRADEEVRITKRFVSEVYSELIPNITKHFGSPSLAATIWGETP